MTLPTRQRRFHHLALLGAALALSACQTPPAAPPPAPAPAPKPVVVEPPPPPAPPPAVETLPGMTPQEVQKALPQVLDLLQDGLEDQAEALLKRILQADPNNRQALSLMRQIRDDPVAILGKDSFAYRVPAGESLSRIAQKCLNDVQLFYALARYNNIKVPRTLAGGQSIRVPGKLSACAPNAAPAPTTPTAASNPPAPPVAQPPAPPASAPSGPSPAAVAEKQKADAIARHTKAARAALAKQDLYGARDNWDAVLALDANNRAAVLERQRVQALIDKFEGLKKPK